MPRPSFSGGDAQARIAELQERMQQSMSATKDMAEQLGALRVVATDENETAEATVDSTGSLVDLRLSGRVLNQHPADTARMIMEAVQAAKTQLAEQTREIVAGTIGADSESGKAVLAGLDKRLRLDEEAN
jgi:DNA-binding protein YbaB